MEIKKIYTYNDQRVFLAEVDKMKGYEPIEEDGYAWLGAYPEELADKCEEFHETYDESYGIDLDDGEEICIANCPNIENEQRMLYGEWLSKYYVACLLENGEITEDDVSGYYDKDGNYHKTTIGKPNDYLLGLQEYLDKNGK